jgi:hypothetical protein
MTTYYTLRLFTAQQSVCITEMVMLYDELCEDCCSLKLSLKFTKYNWNVNT